MDGLTGNATEAASEKLQAELKPVLVDGETILRAFKTVRDIFVFTEQRLILIDKQGLTGKKVQYLSLPYRSITRFAVETGGTFDRDAELRIWISGDPHPLQREIRKGADILSVQRTLARHVLR
jgi:hypothetical protein